MPKRFRKQSEPRIKRERSETPQLLTESEINKELSRLESKKKGLEQRLDEIVLNKNHVLLLECMNKYGITEEQYKAIDNWYEPRNLGPYSYTKYNQAHHWKIAYNRVIEKYPNLKLNFDQCENFHAFATECPHNIPSLDRIDFAQLHHIQLVAFVPVPLPLELIKIVAWYLNGTQAASR